jgi:multicomponent Na+:H+ antiporter subunit E
MTATSSINGTHRLPTRRSWIVWGGLLLGLWWLLVEGQLNGWWFALPIILLALLIRRVMPIPLSLHYIGLWPLITFAPYFIAQSLMGGFDVAWRAFQPKLPIQPAIYSMPFRLQSEGARVFLAQMISLMPGTLSCCVGPQRLIVHVLSGTRETFMADTRELEERTARIFREKLEPVSHG